MNAKLQAEHDKPQRETFQIKFEPCSTYNTNWKEVLLKLYWIKTFYLGAERFLRAFKELLKQDVIVQGN